MFGLGAPVAAMVGTSIGAGRNDRALHVAWTGAGLAFAITEAIGLAAAFFPHAWLSLFGSDPKMLETGTLYLHIVGPSYGFFGGGLALYFASQGAGRVGWAMMVAVLRVIVAAGGGWLAVTVFGGSAALFAVIAAALVIFGIANAAAVASGVWFKRRVPGTDLEDGTMSTTRERLYLDDLAPGHTFRGTGTDAGRRKRDQDLRAPIRPTAVSSRRGCGEIDHCSAGLAASGWHTAALTMQLLVSDGPPLAGGHHRRRHRRIALAEAGAARRHAAHRMRSAGGAAVALAARAGSDQGEDDHVQSERRAGAGVRRQSDRAAKEVIPPLKGEGWRAKRAGWGKA